MPDERHASPVGSSFILTLSFILHAELQNFSSGFKAPRAHTHTPMHSDNKTKSYWNLFSPYKTKF